MSVETRFVPGAIYLDTTIESHTNKLFQRRSDFAVARIGTLDILATDENGLPMPTVAEVTHFTRRQPEDPLSHRVVFASQDAQGYASGDYFNLYINGVIETSQSRHDPHGNINYFDHFELPETNQPPVPGVVYPIFNRVIESSMTDAGWILNNELTPFRGKGLIRISEEETYINPGKTIELFVEDHATDMTQRHLRFTADDIQYDITDLSDKKGMIQNITLQRAMKKAGGMIVSDSWEIGTETPLRYSQSVTADTGTIFKMSADERRQYIARSANAKTLRRQVLRVPDYKNRKIVEGLDLLEQLAA